MTIEDSGIVFVRGSRVRESVPWSDIDRIVIHTTAQGPFDDDVFFVVETSTTSFWIPQPAPGVDTLLQRFQQWDGFQSAQVIEAMSCCENSEFVCWERAQIS